MNVLLISTNRDKGFRPAMPLGMILVASELRYRGFACETLDLCFETDPIRAAVEAARRARPDVVGLSIRNIDQQTALEADFKLPFSRRLVEALRRQAPGCLLVLGGAGVSLFPETILRYLGADYAIAGPGERAFAELLRRLESGTPVAGIPGLAWFAGDACVFEPPTREWSGFGNAPAVERELYDPRYFSHQYLTPVQFDAVAEPVLTKRACPARCAYCGSSAPSGVPVVYRDAAQTAVQIESIVRGGQARRFEFVDAAFNVPYGHAVEVCRELTRRGVCFPWNSMLSPRPVDDALADLMAQTGCDMVEMGAESGCDPILRALRKHFRRKHIASAAAAMQRRGIRLEVCLFAGSPGESLATLRESFAFIDGLVDPARDRVAVNFGYRLLYGTTLYRHALGEGAVSADDDLAYPRYYVAPGTLAEGVLEWIEDWVLAHPRWYIWWGIGRYPLRERYAAAARELEKGCALFRRLLPSRRAPGPFQGDVHAA